MEIILLAACAILGGVAAAVQPSANSALASRIGLPAALVINTTVVLLGTASFLVWSRFVKNEPGRGFFPSGTPAYCYIGGVCGFIVIAAMTFALPRIGAAYAIALMVFGQGLAALAIDHFGLLEIARNPVTWSRLLGLALISGGVLLLKKSA